jgi:hypothetical protein
MKSTDRLYEWIEDRTNSSRFAPSNYPTAGWFIAFSKKHRIIGPFLQATIVVGTVMLIGGVAVQFKSPLFLNALGLVCFVLMFAYTYSYNAWLLKRTDRSDGLPRPT